MADHPAQPVRGLSGSMQVLLLGIACLLLQQVTIHYRIDFFGYVSDASLIHLHTGLLLAIAMLVRDARVVAACFLLAFIGWALRQIYLHDDGRFTWTLAWGGGSYLLYYGWTLMCVRWMGWPRRRESRLQRADLLRFALIGLLLHPLVLALMAVSNMLLAPPVQVLSSVFQMFFAKQFGVAVLTLPLVIGWQERVRLPHLAERARHWAWPLGLALLGLGLSLWAGVTVRRAFTPGGEAAGPVLMDYRFVVLVVLAWSMLRLAPRWAMLSLSLTLLLLVSMVAGTAEYANTTVGLVNLLHIAAEMNIVLLAMLYLWLSNRDRVELAEQLSGETLRDQVTGLPNLKALRERVERPLPRRELGYLLLDQTDTLVAGFGLDTQAQAMNATARRLEDLVETYYVGTGQFALLARPGRDADLWERVMARVEHAEIDVDGESIRLLPYLGVAAFKGAQASVIDGAVLAASHLAFEARQHGELRPRYSDIGDTQLRRTHRRQLHDATEALASLRNERVALYFQPIRDLTPDMQPAPRAITGEVLCRLLDEKGEIMSPARFMAPLEAAGRGAELDLAVVRALFRLLRKSPGALPHCREIAINLTGQSLASMSFQVELRTLLAGSPLPMSALCFEVTETAAISNTAAASHLLADLQALGCQIAIDDFGTGMQSFARLRELPVDVIKIDGSFVRNVAQLGKDYAVVQASVAVAKAFGAITVAEFVEDEDTEYCLRRLGVHRVQGYLYGAPRPLADVLAETAAAEAAATRDIT
ncbi:bifunctional diguanylate cyclase/phosphodiesterase [Pseudoxanthomonas sp. Root65]|uniref:EAL domain-containing protein n=1 Tax=Pseudoxanthomonas sp. Root65 TaxID=1736576 RepID=UPI0012E3BA67|nr:bifunctional diguanylate cyclase/phosphodiesterase [Pseudoxanthomonas sp. Root65]